MTDLYFQDRCGREPVLKGIAGQCISKEKFFDLKYNCFDRSDEIAFKKEGDYWSNISLKRCNATRIVNNVNQEYNGFECTENNATECIKDSDSSDLVSATWCQTPGEILYRCLIIDPAELPTHWGMQLKFIQRPYIVTNPMWKLLPNKLATRSNYFDSDGIFF